MSKPDKKNINKRAAKMENGWEAEAPVAKFKKHTLEDLKAKRQTIEATEQEVEDLKAQAKLKDGEIDDMYHELDEFMVEVGEGVRGHDDYGNDSPLYGAMGFVRKSQRKSGLTRKSKNKNGSDKG
jgi:hypothetical protein